MKEFEERSLKEQSKILTWFSIFITILGIILLSKGLTDFFLEDKASFWSILYIIVGFVLIARYRFNHKGYLESKKLEKELG